MADAAGWNDLFVMSGGAAAALAGLIFVAVSVNVEQILGNRMLPLLAARTLAVLIGEVLLSVLVLAPGQPVRRLGVETLVLGLVLAVVVFGGTVRGAEAATVVQSLDDYAVAVAATVPLVVGGIWMTAGADGGLYWLMGEVLGGIVAATYNAWILLIEIRR